MRPAMLVDPFNLPEDVMTRYNFGSMAQGDYILVPKRTARRACAAAYMYAVRNPGFKFQCHKWGRRGRYQIKRLFS